MTLSQDVSIALSLLNVFAGSNPTVEALETFIPQLATVLAAERAGQSFSISFPVSLSGVAGTASISWSPSPAAPATA